MTYEEVVKALECCSRPAECINCPLYDNYGLNCISVLRHATFDLLRKQKAEIERLNYENLKMIAEIKNLKAEAIKEFAEKASRDISEINPNRPSDDKEDIIEQALACVDGVRFKMLFGNGR